MKVRIRFEFFDDNGNPVDGVNYNDIYPNTQKNEIVKAISLPHIKPNIENGFKLFKDMWMMILDLDHMEHSSTSAHGAISSYTHHFNPERKDLLEICDQVKMNSMKWIEEKMKHEIIPGTGQK